MARLYREAPLNSVWEGSGNVMCLDVLRAMVREPQSIEALRDELRSAMGADKRYDNFVAELFASVLDGAHMEFRARTTVERIALALQASVLLKAGNASIADPFIATRLGGHYGRNFGTLAYGTDVDTLIERAMPA